MYCIEKRFIVLCEKCIKLLVWYKVIVCLKLYNNWFLFDKLYGKLSNFIIKIYCYKNLVIEFLIGVIDLC